MSRYIAQYFSAIRIKSPAGTIPGTFKQQKNTITILVS